MATILVLRRDETSPFDNDDATLSRFTDDCLEEELRRGSFIITADGTFAPEPQRGAAWQSGVQRFRPRKPSRKYRYGGEGEFE